MGRNPVCLCLKGERACAGFATWVNEVGQATGSVEGGTKVSSEGWAKGSRPAIRVDLDMG